MSSLLPPNATPTEYRLEQALNLWARLAQQTERLRRIKDPSDPKHPHFNGELAGEWTIAPFRRFFTDETRFFSETISYLKSRGTLSAVWRVLTWIDLAAEVEVEHSYMHLGLDHIYRGHYEDLKFLVRHAIPAQVWFYRVFHDYDIRVAWLSESAYDNNMYDDDSGVIIEDLKRSYGDRHKTVCAFSIHRNAPQSAQGEQHGSHRARTWRHATPVTWAYEPWQPGGHSRIIEERA